MPIDHRIQYHDRILSGACVMKNLWFHLMPYKDLPGDFREKHAS